MKRHNRNAQVRLMKPLLSRAQILILAVLVCFGLASRAEAQPAGAGGLACNFVGRVYLEPQTGKGQVAGYYTDITGIPGPLFSSAPSAFFTFRSDVLQLTPLPPNGDLQLFLGSPGKFAIYFNSTPSGDWSNPDSFSSGQPIAAFQRAEFLDLLFAQTGQHQHLIREDLVSAQPFTFNGRTYDFHSIAPVGLTLFNFISNIPEAGISGFPLVLPYAGSCIGVAG